MKICDPDMSLADSILQPHPPEVLAALLQKRIDEVDAKFPGLVEKSRAWLLSDDFKKVYREVPGLVNEDVFRMSTAPFSIRYKIAKIAGLHVVANHTREWIVEGGDDMINWFANYLWKSEGMSEKYYENLRYRYEFS